MTRLARLCDGHVTRPTSRPAKSHVFPCVSLTSNHSHGLPQKE